MRPKPKQLMFLLAFTVLGGACATAPAKSDGPAAAGQEEVLIQKLVQSSPWNGEFGDQRGTFTVSFAMSGGAPTGELISITGSQTAFPGPITSIKVKGDTVSFYTPGNNVYVEMRLKEGTFTGDWVGRNARGWISMSPSKK